MDEPEKAILQSKVKFYQRLSSNDKKRFEDQVMQFLTGVTIRGIDTDINEEDKILVAASAVIPVFGFPEWIYTNLDEVLLYPDSFNPNFETSGEGRAISGMVGWGFMNRTMTISKPSLHSGFEDQNSKSNVGIHEFVHLIDKTDGATDGVPDVLIANPNAIPWLKMMKDEIARIRVNRSDLNPYGGSNEAEFYSVASEYFFNRPRLFKKKHPELYKVLSGIFRQDPARTEAS